MFRFIASIFDWFADEMGLLWAQLQKRDTWILIGMLTMLGGLVALTVYSLLRFDATIKLRHLSMITCQDIGNLQSVGLYFGGFAFIMAIIVAFGEFANYTDEKAHDKKSSMHSARSAIILAMAATAVGAGILLFLNQLCG